MGFFNGVTLPSFDPFFTGVFFIFYVSLEFVLPYWALLRRSAHAVPNIERSHVVATRSCIWTCLEGAVQLIRFECGVH
jgi:hypothetical protein